VTTGGGPEPVAGDARKSAGVLSRAARLRLAYLWGYRTEDVDAYGFTGGRPLADAGRFLGYDWYLSVVRPVLNDGGAKVLTENKWVFYRFADSFGLPVPRTLGLFDPVHGVTWDGERPMRTVHDVLTELRRQRPGALVIKPAGGGRGSHVLILDAIDHDTGGAVTRTGEQVDLEATLTSLDLTGMRGVSGYVLQEPVRNHEELAQLAPWAANTVRIQTFLTGEGSVAVQGAVLRLGRRGGMVDNYSLGGLSVPVDAATATLGRGVLPGSTERLTHHPDTGLEFTGRQVPRWNETVDLCVRAARLFPGLRSLGWDVVITASGPVLLEGNADWGLRSLQMHTDGWLADPVIRAQLESLGVPLPTGRFTADIGARLLRRLVRRFRRLGGRLLRMIGLRR
jgi:hypothetical protein